MENLKWYCGICKDYVRVSYDGDVTCSRCGVIIASYEGDLKPAMKHTRGILEKLERELAIRGDNMMDFNLNYYCEEFKEAIKKDGVL